ncbi:HAD family phosphatase [Streptomyces sp. NPDC051364]|uniref:HAD family hydrolase n=1 Tax=Streptomyces sp. NPDC051364 TaxID=3155799 RepID=UPI00342FBBB8
MSDTVRLPACSGPTPGEVCVPAIPIGFRALILDYDGTLADTAPGNEQALRAALQPYGIDLDAHWYGQHVGLSIHDLLTALPGGQALPHTEVIQRSRANLLASMHTIEPIACVLALLRSARRAGLPCAIASNASRILVDPGLDALSLREEFAAVVTREDVSQGKPHPALFTEAARRLSTSPDSCLAVDDAPEGIASARAAGMRVITVVGGHLALTDDVPQPKGSV